MPGSLHFEAPTALDYFATLVADDAGLPLFEAAVALAQDEDPRLDVQAVLARVDALGAQLQRRLPDAATPLVRLRSLNRFFFDELGFGGNVNDYYDRRNSLIPAVLESRRGIPITLAVLYLELAAHAGLNAQGVSFPGHFLVKVRMPRGEAVIDPFSGASLSRDDLEERLEPFRRRHGNSGDALPLALFLQAARPREIVARMLRNLKEIDTAARDWPRLAAVLQRLVIVLPQAWEERRDRALVLAELGSHAQAVDELTLYLRKRPGAADAPALRRHLAAWRRAG